MTAIALTRPLLDNQRRQDILHRDFRVLQQIRSMGHFVSPAVDAELRARGEWLRVERAAVGYHLQRVRAANDAGCLRVV